jgi:hypothetical protein
MEKASPARSHVPTGGPAVSSHVLRGLGREPPACVAALDAEQDNSVDLRRSDALQRRSGRDRTRLCHGSCGTPGCLSRLWSPPLSLTGPVSPRVTRRAGPWRPRANVGSGVPSAAVRRTLPTARPASTESAFGSEAGASRAAPTPRALAETKEAARLGNRLFWIPIRMRKRGEPRGGMIVGFLRGRAVGRSAGLISLGDVLILR